MARITEDMVSQFIHLRRQGRSYRSISEEFGVDARTVKAHVDRAEQARERDHWEAVSRQVDARYLDEHLRMVVHTSLAVLNAVRTQPLFGPPDRGADELLQALTDSEIHGVVHSLLEERGVDLEAPVSTSLHDSIGSTAKPRLAARLTASLMEHEPALRRSVETWKRLWRRLQEERAVLADEATGILGIHLSEDTARQLGLAVAQDTLEAALLGAQPGDVGVENDDPHVVVLVREASGGREELCTCSIEEGREAPRAYSAVLVQIEDEERTEPAEEAYQRLLGCIEEIEDLVDTLVLRGHPEGRCSLCNTPTVADPKARTTAPSTSESPL